MNSSNDAGQVTAAVSQPSSASSPNWPSFMVGQAVQPVRVLLVDDDAHLRNVVAGELMADPRVLLVGQAKSFKEAKVLMRQLQFDVLLADLNLEDGTGIDLIAQQRALRPSAETVIISVMEGDVQLLRAIEQGAAGYIVKHCWFGSYVQAVLQVANGGAAITPHLARRLLQRLSGVGSGQQALELEQLSVREGEILKLVAHGCTSAEIAKKLSITALTVNTHIRNVYRKLKVKSRAQAVRAALLKGLL